jgi:hypothetical protein
LIVALSLILLAGCAPRRPDIWVDRLEIVVREDLSATVRFIVMQWQSAIDEQMEASETPSIEAYRDLVRQCNFDTADYLKNGAAPGFIASAEFSGSEELEYALTCIPLLAQLAAIHRLKVDERPWGTSYELQLDLGYPEAFHEVQITLPGSISVQTGAIPAGLSVETERASPDTILYTISGSRPCRGWGCPVTVVVTVMPTTEEVIVKESTKVVLVEHTVLPPTTTPSPQPTASRTPTATPSPQPTAATPSATETPEGLLVLTARSFQPNLPVIGLLALLAVLIVGGPLLAGVRVRRKRARRAAAGMGAAKLEQFHGALLDAFRSHHSLGRMVRFELGENLEEIAGQGPLADVAYHLVEWADAEGRLDDLLRGARAQNPGNERLRRLEELTALKARNSRA